MGVCNIRGMVLAGETEVLEEKPVPVSLCPPDHQPSMMRNKLLTY